MLPVLSKVLEKFAISKFVHWKNFGKNQFAFVRGKGTGTTCALTYVVNGILKHLDKPGAVRMLMLDYSKAFDKALPCVILESLEKLGVSGSGLAWFYSFLSDRVQRTSVNGHFSQWSAVTSGVPQGSCCGPICFAAINEHLRAHFRNSELVKYADDTTLLHFIREQRDDHMQEEFDHLQRQIDALGMLLNTSKTKEMILSSNSKLILHPLLAGEQVIESVSKARLLGLTLSEDLK